MENYKCPICIDDKYCFEEIENNIKSYICYKCGMSSNENIKSLKQVNKFSKDFVYFNEETNSYWHPIILQIAEFTLYPEYNENEWYNWTILFLDKESKSGIPIQMEEKYSRFNFLNACESIGANFDFIKEE